MIPPGYIHSLEIEAEQMVLEDLRVAYFTGW